MVLPRRKLEVWPNSHSHEVDEPSFGVGLHETDPEPIADVESLEASLEFAFDGRAKQADPGALLRGTCHNGVELLTDSIGKPERRGRLANAAFDFIRGIFLPGAVLRKRRQLGEAVRRSH